ncbi:Phosphorylase b kinase regulatory subunit alpha, skeletal muscle isoform [Cichlidogyrus casuarinus]|uniref:Phosphorylase b kinase regulatory subunit alpha, skeletal muscle isoform n=1 Tax=Cichlidogyrus casuarinus TaxID=1844966 RepID=A0ABD2PLX9_9PLAT
MHVVHLSLLIVLGRQCLAGNVFKCSDECTCEIKESEIVRCWVEVKDLPLRCQKHWDTLNLVLRSEEQVVEVEQLLFNCQNLKSLSISTESNQRIKIASPRLLRNMSQLRILHLESIHFSSVDMARLLLQDTTFLEYTSLVKTNIDQEKFAEILKDAPISLINLRVIDSLIEGQLPARMFTSFCSKTNPKSLSMTIDGSRISSIHPEAFVGCFSLSKLQITRSLLTASLEQAIGIEWKGASPSYGAFYHLPNLQKLDLENNNLLGIRSDSWAMNLDKVSFLSLAGNNLRFIANSSFQRLKNLGILDLSRNPKFSTPVNPWKSNSVELRNGIVVETFENLCNLKRVIGLERTCLVNEKTEGNFSQAVHTILESMPKCTSYESANKTKLSEENTRSISHTQEEKLMWYVFLCSISVCCLGLIAWLVLITKRSIAAKTVELHLLPPTYTHQESPSRSPRTGTG